MADEAVCISSQQTKPIKILKWKIRQGITVSVGRIILLYEIEGAEKPEQKKLKAVQAGTIDKIIAQEGSTVHPSEPLYSIQACSHPTIMNDMCAECGADLRKDETTSATASVPMIHSIPDLKVSEEQAQQLGRADSERLIKDRKLVLLVDLDQTLIHTTNDNIPPNIKDVYHFQLYGPNSPWYHTRLRPRTHKFLNSIYDFFELHICTFGARNYAHTIAMFLDPEQKFFSNRILSRDECFDPTSKKANLKALFPCGDDMVCIIDDREDVWNHASNLIHVKPYHFFQHTGDINAPPGLDKHENDDKAGVDLTKIANDVEKKQETSNTNGIKQKDCDGDEVHDEGDTVESKKGEEKEDKNKEMTNGNKIKEESEPSDSPSEEVEETEDGEVIDDRCLKEIQDNIKEKDIEKSENDKQAPPIEVPNGKLKVTEPPDIDTTSEKEEDEVPADPNPTPKIKFNKEDNLIEIEDPDDYLIYLEDILKRIHSTYYEEYDKMESGEIPDLKKIIPIVRSSVLKGCRLVFSGLVPTHVKLENSKAYQVARSLGADVTQDLEDDTTHIVAVRPGTAKVNAGRRKKNLKIVMPDWLWSCAERWEHVDERIFPLNSKGSKNRHPPPHCSSPEHITMYPEHNLPAMRKRTPSGRFMDTINPLMSFSSDDIADMDKEVEDILEDDESDEDEGETYDEEAKKVVETNVLGKVEEEESSSSEGMDYDEDDYPKGHKRKHDVVIVNDDDLEEENNSAEDDTPSVKFRRGEILDSELDVEQDEEGSEEDSQSSFEPPDPDEMDDGEWNMMGAALEREFLSE